MITITHEATIEQPPEEVFAFLADPTNDPRWCPPVLEATQIEGSGAKAGARYRQKVKPGPKELANTFEITEYQPNRRMAWKGSNGMLDFHGHYNVEPANGGTRIAMVSNLEMKGLWRLLGPIISRASRSTAEEEFQKLKRLLESEQAVSR